MTKILVNNAANANILDKLSLFGKLQRVKFYIGLVSGFFMVKRWYN